MFTKRLGSTAQRDVKLCSGGYTCPDILEMESGDFAIIGEDITQEAEGKLLPGSGCGPGERVVRIPRELLINAKRDIPASA